MQILGNLLADCFKEYGHRSVYCVVLYLEYFEGSFIILFQNNSPLLLIYFRAL